MVDFAKALNEIKETEKQIELTSSNMRKTDLKKRLKRLKKEYNLAKIYCNNKD